MSSSRGLPTTAAVPAGVLGDWVLWAEGDRYYHRDGDRPGYHRHKRGWAEYKGLRPCYTCYTEKGVCDG